MTVQSPYDEVVLRDGGTIPSKYDGIDLTATRQMQRAAERGKALRRKHRRGGTRKGLNMANRILSGQRIHPDNVRDMFAFFERFASTAQKQRGTDKWNVASDKVGPLRIAWDLWGGDAGRSWSRGKRRQLAAADEREKRSVIESLGPVQRSAIIHAESPRPQYWRQWLDAVQRPTERQIRAQWRRGRAGIFPDQVKRYNARIGQVLKGTRSIRRNISDEEMRAILMDELEYQFVLDEFDDEVIEAGVRRAYSLVALRLTDEVLFDPMLDPSKQIIGDMIQFVQQVTKDRVAQTVRAGLAQGVSIGDIQRALQFDHAFSPARALTIARTETARTVSEGQEMAFNQAANIGVRFEREWVSSRDNAVRKTHELMDGQRREPGLPFDSRSGAKGLGPGLFKKAAEDINCRCVVRPVNIRG